MLKVKVRNGEIEKALKQIKRKFIATKVVREVRERSQFTKKSTLRRDEVKKARYIQKLRDIERD